jgi:sulfonate transport system substrate-binding protein
MSAAIHGLPCLLLVVAIPCGCVSDKQTKATSTTINMALEFSSHSACAHIGRKKGWFKEQGIQIKAYDSYVTGMALTAALARGDVDVAYICLIPAINAYANAGVPIKVAAGIHRYGYGLVVNPDKVKTIKDLEKPDIRIGVPRAGAPPDALFHKLMEKFKLDKKQTLAKARRMNPPQQLLALKLGQIDAGLICEQYPTMAEGLGFKMLLTAKDLWPNMQGSVLVVRNELIKNHPEIVRKLVKVTRRATQFINEHPDEAGRIVASALSVTGKTVFPIQAAKASAKLKITPAALKKSITERLDCTVEIDEKMIQETIDYVAGLGNIKARFKAAELLDLRFLHER